MANQTFVQTLRFNEVRPEEHFRVLRRELRSRSLRGDSRFRGRARALGWVSDPPGRRRQGRYLQQNKVTSSNPTLPAAHDYREEKDVTSEKVSNVK